MFYSWNAQTFKVHGQNVYEGIAQIQTVSPRAVFCICVSARWKVRQTIRLFFAAQLSSTKPTVLGTFQLEKKG